MATQEYDKTNTKRVNLKLNNRTDADIIEKLGQVENIQGFIKAIIRNEMEGAKEMKAFNRITNELYGAKKAGFRLEYGADREVDEQLLRLLTAERGERFVNNKLDSLYDLDGDLYEDENGDPYAVVFVSAGNQEKPLCWHRLVKPVSYHIRPEFLDRWGEDATEETTLTWDDVLNITRGWDMSPVDVLDQLIPD